MCFDGMQSQHGPQTATKASEPTQVWQEGMVDYDGAVRLSRQSHRRGVQTTAQHSSIALALEVVQGLLAPAAQQRG